jgi:hypothetical protein
MNTTARDSPDVHPPAGQRFLYWLAEAAKQVREHAGVRPETVASILDVGIHRIDRFEKAENWPRDAEQLLAAYAAATGLEDARDIYQRALDLWYEHGTAPLLSAKEDSTTGRDATGRALPSGRAQAEPLPPLRRARTAKRSQTDEPTTDGPALDRRRRRA